MNTARLFVFVPSGSTATGAGYALALSPGADYINQIEENRRFKHLLRNDYTSRLAFAANKSFDTLVYTGALDPLSNPDFIGNVASWNSELDHPFRWIELDTTVAFLDEKRLEWLRNTISVSTVNLALASIDDAENARYFRLTDAAQSGIESACTRIKALDFNLTLRLLLTQSFDTMSGEELFAKLVSLRADRVELRIIREPGNTNETRLVPASDETIRRLEISLSGEGRRIEHETPFESVFSLRGMRVSLVRGSRGFEPCEPGGYFVLAPDCRLYSQWGDRASLIF